ncbi:MAG TPA: IclR family transcriptional regulator [Candidatus Agathobaculum pullicola]|nr:IclR family transcriptional regulator [Candidatus Agathobaculum pullicola]
MAQDQHRTTTRILDILEHVSAVKAGMTLTELAQTLNAPKSSLFPIVHTLEERRYLQQNHETGRYIIGPSGLVLGAAFSADSGMEPVTKIMKHVVAVCQETCQFGILDHGNVLYVGKEDSTQAIRMISWVGNRLPANATAIGKALLSGLTDDEIRALYADGMPRLTEHTITDLNILLAQLDAIRHGEIATEKEESTAQMLCWALPLRRQGKVFAALSISVPLFRCQEEKIAQVIQCLKQAQTEIEQLGELIHFF